MKKGYKGAIITLVIILIGIIVYNILISQGVIRNYHIKDFVIDVTMQDNGDIFVKEDTVYRFNGQYNGITITIPTNVSKEYYSNLTKDSMNDSKRLPDSLYISNGIEDVKIYTVEDGTNKYFDEVGTANIGASGVYTVSYENGFTTYTIYEPSNSENKQIVIEYTLKDVMVQHKDSAELFWNFIGGEVECTIKNLEINIYGQNIAKAYTHGNSSGKIANSFSLAKINYRNVKPGEFVSARIATNTFSSKMAKQSNIEALPIIEKLEESYGSKKQTIIDLSTAGIIMTIGILAYWFFLLFVYEKEIEPVPLVMNDLDVLNKYNPMIAACIAQNRGMHPRDILAVLIDLVNIGALKMSHAKGYIGDKETDTYKLTKNEDFFNDQEKITKLDDIQSSIIHIFFSNSNEIELTKRLKQIQSDSDVADALKFLDDKVATKLETIGANYEKVPKALRVFNTFMFFIICIYILIMFGYNISLSYVTLSVTGSSMVYEVLASMEILIVLIAILFPVLIILLKGIIKILEFMRKNISKIAFKLTTRKLTRTIIILVIIFALVILFEFVVFKDSNVMVGTLLFFAALLVILTDNLMTSHNTNLQKEYVMLKLLQDKIENGSLLDEKEIKDNTLWNRYLTFAIALGVGNVEQYMKYIPDYSSMESILDYFYNTTDGYFGLYGLHREMYIQAKLTKFMLGLDKMNKAYMKVAMSGGSGSYGSSRGFSSGGGRFSGGGGRGGGRGAF